MTKWPWSRLADLCPRYKHTLLDPIQLVACSGFPWWIGVMYILKLSLLGLSRCQTYWLRNYHVFNKNTNRSWWMARCLCSSTALFNKARGRNSKSSQFLIAQWFDKGCIRVYNPKILCQGRLWGMKYTEKKIDIDTVYSLDFAQSYLKQWTSQITSMTYCPLQIQTSRIVWVKYIPLRLRSLMNVLFWVRCDFHISFSGRDM